MPSLKIREAEQLLAVALSYVGTKESPPGSNRVIFNDHYYGHAVEGEAYPWCAAYVWDVFRLAGLSRLFYGGGKSAYCPAIESWARTAGLVVGKTEGTRGDVVLMDFGRGRASHIGIITGGPYADGSYDTVEGNTSVTSDDNGGAVMQRHRGQNVIRTIYRPAYGGGEMQNLKRGHKGAEVKEIQKQLISLAVSCGGSGADGDFGPATEQAVRTYQSMMGLSVDGIAGPATRGSLAKASAPEPNPERLCAYVALTYRMAHLGGYKYGDSAGVPPCADHIISCDRLISRALWDMDARFRDQRRGGEVSGTLDSYLTSHGFSRVTSAGAVRRGDVVRMADKGNSGMWHVFFILDNLGDSRVRKYDTGSNARIKGAQPTTVPLNEWGAAKWFSCAWRLLPAPAPVSTATDEVKGLQEYINSAYITPGAVRLPRLEIDGSFGGKTAEAYRAVTAYLRGKYKAKI